MSRLLFAKEGSAIYISHLDLMRVFQRSFRRAGLMLKHTQGFTPHAMVSIALPLSVGVSSQCELLDYELAEGFSVPAREVAERLNRALPAGIRVLRAYDGGRKIRELQYLRAVITMEYDRGVPDGASEDLEALFKRESLLMDKQSKRSGLTQVDILPLIRELAVERKDENTLLIHCTICAQNPSLNPAMLPAAVEKYAPELRPDFSFIHRENVLCADLSPFR